VLGCGKHFPGLGGGTLDSHHAMPEIDRGWQQLWEEDLLPYRKLHRQLPFVMVSHASYSRVKATQGPASVSSYWIRDVLKKKIGYRGLVLSDDMEMGGILTQHSIEEASIAAIEAGTHLVEVCKEPALVLRTYEALLSEAERSRAFRKRVEQAAAHMAKNKQRLLGKAKQRAVPSSSAVEAMRQRVLTFSETVKQISTHE
jgi:beta-N-acetylhexosaminidase